MDGDLHLDVTIDKKRIQKSENWTDHLEIRFIRTAENSQHHVHSSIVVEQILNFDHVFTFLDHDTEYEQ